MVSSFTLPSSSSLDYLLSNNHVNSIIMLKLDFSDEEVLAYYISFLKTLSFKLNKHTIHFFYNEVSSPMETVPDDVFLKGTMIMFIAFSVCICYNPNCILQSAYSAYSPTTLIVCALYLTTCIVLFDE